MIQQDIDNKQQVITVTVKHGHGKYLIAMAVEIVLLYVLNNLLHSYISTLAPYVTNTYPRFIVVIVDSIASWQVPFFTDEFTSCLWAINVALSLAILANLGLLLYHPRWVHHLTKGLILGIALLPVYVVYKVFPFQFTAGIQEKSAKVILIVVVAILAIGFIVQMIRFVITLFHKIKIDKERAKARDTPVMQDSEQATPSSSEQSPKDPPGSPGLFPPY